jgi:hypothetical protein
MCEWALIRVTIHGCMRLCTFFVVIIERHLREDGRSEVRDSIPGSRECEAGVLLTRSRPSDYLELKYMFPL